MQEAHKVVAERELPLSVTQFSQPSWLSTLEKLLKLADITLHTEDHKKEPASQDSCHSPG